MGGLSGRVARGAARAIAASLLAACAAEGRERPRAAPSADSLALDVNPADPAFQEPVRGSNPAAGASAPRGLPALIERRAEPCRTLAATPERAALALEGCARAGRELTRVLGAPVPPGLVLAVLDPGDTVNARTRLERDEQWVLPIGAPAPDELELGEGQRLSPLGYVTHQAAHRIVPALLGATPLPAWLAEGVAVVTEPADDQATRLTIFTDPAGGAPVALATFLTMPRPAPDRSDAATAPRRRFDGQAFALAQFVEETAGAGALGRLAGQLRDGSPQLAALAAVLGGPPDAAAIDGRWRAWLGARRAGAARSGGAAPAG